MRTITYRDAIAETMRHALTNHDNTILFGLGVTDHTGVFGTTKGLLEVFGEERVFETPIAEESMTGFALGASLSGLYPIHIHIRTDFVLLAMSQLVNSIAKYRYMYGGLFEAPMLIRSIVGRSWGQGAQHSQSLQALFAHSPGLYVVMPSSARTASATYRHAVSELRSPVVSLEHRLLYDYSFGVNGNEDAIGNPFTSFRVREGEHVTIVATSIMVQESVRAAAFAMEREGLGVEIVDLHCVSHPDESLILESVRKTGKLIVVDTGWESFGVCAEIARIVATGDPGALKLPMVSLSVAKSPCPTAKSLENCFYPDMADIVRALYALHFGSESHGRELPDPETVDRLHRDFKGPF
ncbi:MAG: alpha-ketoacid dehydrogenase subunit beta [Syntrophobacteraceae bacterium]